MGMRLLRGAGAGGSSLVPCNLRPCSPILRDGSSRFDSHALFEADARSVKALRGQQGLFGIATGLLSISSFRLRVIYLEAWRPQGIQPITNAMFPFSIPLAIVAGVSICAAVLS